MEDKINVGVLGATGAVGQRIVSLLENHPIFNLDYLAASDKSAGPTYERAMRGRWLLDRDIPYSSKDLIVFNVNDIPSEDTCKIVFSCLDMPDKTELAKLEESYARAGFGVFSNASAHRETPYVPMLIPEINYSHLELINYQKKHLFNERGFIVVKPNCSLQSYLTPVHALISAGYPVSLIDVTTLQACSGAGERGIKSLEKMMQGLNLVEMIRGGNLDLAFVNYIWNSPEYANALDIVNNVLPNIPGEEVKTEKEPLKILGQLGYREIINNNGIRISAQCNRVPVMDGHMACVKLKFKDLKPTIEQIKGIWRGFRGIPQQYADLPSAPIPPIIYLDDEDRPQPKLDKDSGNGMAVTVGRLAECNVFDIKFVGLSHNTIRGAAGGNILNAELAYRRGYF